jgi:dTDP-4-amino-4,6-dideoxygalactose transaminase
MKIFLRESLKKLYEKYKHAFIVKNIVMLLKKRSYPIILGKEKKLVNQVLKSRNWNMSYGRKLIHHILEDEMENYFNVAGAVVVSSGGMALQMTLRGLGLKHNDEVIHVVDTCVANSFSILNSGLNPIFCDSNIETYLMDKHDVENQITENTKAIMPIHLWGNIEDMDVVNMIAEKYQLKVVEDACLAFSGKFKDQYVGTLGDVGVFSFGSSKPIQAGEGGIIVSNDSTFIREMKAMRHWGDKTLDYGVRDHDILSWNGRTSEINCAVMLEQFRAYKKRFSEITNSVEIVKKCLDGIEGVEIVTGAKNAGNTPSYSQINLRINSELYTSKTLILKLLYNHGISARDANFELIPSINFFKSKRWQDWVISNDLSRIESNYSRVYKNAQFIFDRCGIGIPIKYYNSEKKAKNLSMVLRRVFDVN